MKKVTQLPNTDYIQEQACGWIAKIDAGTMSESDKAALEQWLNDDSLHARALMEMADLLDDMTVLSQLSELIPLDTLSISNQRKKPVVSFNPTPIKALVGICFLALLGLLFSVQNLWQQETDSNLSANTGIGEYKTVHLPDNSQVTLNTYSQVNIEFNDRERRVVLTRGEAHFEVESDTKRPFKVLVGDKVVTAVGTAFNIKTKGQHIELTVTEGSVEITSGKESINNNKASPPGQGNSAYQPAVTRVTAGHLAIVADGVESLQPIDPISIEKKLAWQKGVVVFEGETLGEVVEEISRYTTTTFIITDKEARAIRVGGYFEIGDIEKMLDILEHGFSISARSSPSGTIYLSRLELEENKN